MERRSAALPIIGGLVGLAFGIWFTTFDPRMIWFFLATPTVVGALFGWVIVDSRR